LEPLGTSSFFLFRRTQHKSTVFNPEYGEINFVLTVGLLTGWLSGVFPEPHDPEIEELLAGLSAVKNYCDEAYSVTDAQLAEAVPQRGVNVRAQALIFNASHTNNHYGNLVTYMRLKGMVPPSTAR